MTDSNEKKELVKDFLRKHYSNKSFEDIITTAYALLKQGNIVGAKLGFLRVYNAKLPGASRDIVLLSSLLYDIMGKIIDVQVPYSIVEIPDNEMWHESEYETSRFGISRSIEPLHLKAFLHEDRFPWIKRVGLTPLISRLISDFYKPEYSSIWFYQQQNMFLKGYGQSSVVKFGKYKNCTVNEILDIDPNIVFDYQNTLIHFFVGTDVLFDQRVRECHLSGRLQSSLFVSAARSYVKSIIASVYFDVSYYIQESRRQSVEEEKARRKEQDSAYWDALENDPENYWNID